MAQDALDLAIAGAIEQISRFVVPIYVDGGSRPELLGSGFFVQTAKHLALVSAAHVLNQASVSNPIFACRTSNDVVQITGERHLTDPAGLDLGFILVNGVSLPWPEVDRYACRPEYLMGRRVPRGNRHYVIAGYPETKSRVQPRKKSIYASLHAYHSQSIPDSEYSDYKLSPESHLALPLDLGVGFDADGKQVNFPKPNGMSGSPIWELLDYESHSSQERVFPLVAIGTDYRRSSKVLHGSDVGPLLSRLAAA